MLSEFKQFAMRGNVIDMAVGIVIGAAFAKIVNSFVSDLLMPPIGLLAGKVNFSNLFIALDGKAYGTLAAAREAGAATLNYGLFVSTIIDFSILAFAIFMLVRWMNRLTQQEEDKKDAIPPGPSREEELLTEIRDLLKTGDVSRETTKSNT